MGTQAANKKHARKHVLIMYPTGEQYVPRVKQICHGVGVENLSGIVTEFNSGNELHQPGFDISDVASLLQFV